MKQLRHILLALVCLLFTVSCEAPYERNTSRIDNFTALWNILDTKYCYFTQKQIDWDGVYAAYYGKAMKAKSEEELFDVFATMLDTLQDGHVNLYSPFDVSRCRGWYEDFPTNYNSGIVYGPNYLTLDYKIAGGLHYQLIANGEIGLIRYSDFSYGFSSPNLHYISRYFSNCKGIIIDVRNNGGGRLDYAQTFASCFFKEKQVVGYMQHKTGPGHDQLSSPEAVEIDPTTAPIDWSDLHVAVLTNRRCYSATNDFVSKVQYAPNVEIIGGITGGGGGMPASSELPNGWLVRYSSVRMLNAEKEDIEFGVTPEIIVTMKPEDEIKGLDTLIERAITWILEQQ